MSKSLLKSGLILLVLMSSSGVSAQLTRGYESTGTIDRVDLKEHTIVISDQAYRLSPQVAIRSKRGRQMRSSTRQLVPGTRVGYTVEGAGGGRSGEITSLWLNVLERSSEE